MSAGNGSPAFLSPAAGAPVVLAIALFSTQAFAGVLTLDMETAVSMALKRNTDLVIAEKRQEQARRQETEALGMALPDLDVSASYTYQGNVQKVEFGGMEFQFRPDNEYMVNASLNQYLYSGAVSSGYKAARILTRAAGEKSAAARNDVVTDVKIKMYNALYTFEIIRVNEESVEQLRSHLADSKAREEVGLNTRYDTMRFETRLADAIPSLIAAKNDHSAAIAVLLDTVGADPLLEVRVKGKLVYEPLSITLEEAVAAAEASRPEMLASKLNHSAAESLTDAARSELLPTLKAFGNYSYSNLAVGVGGQTEWRNDWSVGLKVELNLFDGRERSSRVGRRRLDEEIALLQKDKTRRMIRVEVKTAYDELRRAGEFVRSQEKNVGYAEETYRIASRRLEEGVGTQLELLDAQLALTRAKMNHSRSLYEYSVARARLERAMGTVETAEKR